MFLTLWVIHTHALEATPLWCSLLDPLGSPMWAHLSLLDERSPLPAPRCPFLAPVVGLTIQSEIKGFLTIDFACTFHHHHGSFGFEKPSPIHYYWSQSPRRAPKCSHERSPWVRLPKRNQSCVMNVCIIWLVCVEVIFSNSMVFGDRLKHDTFRSSIKNIYKEVTKCRKCKYIYIYKLCTFNFYSAKNGLLP